MTDSQDIAPGYCRCGCGAYVGVWPISRPQRGQKKGDPKPYAQGHWVRTPIEDRLWPKVDRSGGPEACWEFVGARDPNGYGRIRHGDNARLAHRVAYEISVGPIPDGLTLDHLCRNTSCVNPAHLEPVTVGENVLRGTAPSAVAARKTHCKNGHPLSGGNLQMEGSKRRCKTCQKLKEQKRWAARKG